MDKVPSINAVGFLIYLALTTRSDITYAVGCLVRYTSNQSSIYWKAIKYLFKYLQSIKDYKLVYGPSNTKELFVTYSDTNHGACKDTGRSTGGYIIKIGTRG